MSDQINREEQIPVKKKSFLSSTASRVILSAVIILFAVLAVKGIAFAKHIHKFADGPGAFIIDRIAETLDLSSDQKARVEKIKDQIKEKVGRELAVGRLDLLGKNPTMTITVEPETDLQRLFRNKFNQLESFLQKNGIKKTRKRK